ncbi:Retrovirus-related Pol polyprotein from transposon TNT 1-94, partial [Glycine soja]
IEWTKIQRKAVSTIRLVLAPEIRHNVLKEITPKALWEKLKNIYASKSLTNHLCLKMELYQLKMEMGGDLHDHINKFNWLVSQLLNANDKFSDEEQALLLLVSLPRSFKALVQTFLVGRSTLNLDEVIAAL